MDVLKQHCVEVQPLSLFTQVSGGGHLVLLTACADLVSIGG